MKLKFMLGIAILFFIIFSVFVFVKLNFDGDKIIGLVIHNSDDFITVRDQNGAVYILNNENFYVSNGDMVVIEYDGDINQDSAFQEILILDYEVSFSVDGMNDRLLNWIDDELFNSYYVKAYDKLKTMSLDEKIG